MKTKNQKPRLYISIDQKVLDDLKTIAKALGEPVGRIAAQMVEEATPKAMDHLQVFNESVENDDTQLVLATKLMSTALTHLNATLEEGTKVE